MEIIQPILLKWYIYLIIGGISLLGVLTFAAYSKTAEHFSRLAIVQFFAISAVVVSFILSISFIPLSSIDPHFPITTEQITTNNQTQWMLNIGGIKTVENSVSGGLQIPIYVIIAGILGSYIRYLYFGIKQFKEKHSPLIQDLDDAYTSLNITEIDLQKVDFGKEPVPETLLNAYKEEKEKLEDAWEQNSTKVRKKYIALRMDEIHHVLESLGFIFLAPLLAVSAWLMLSIGGTDNHYTFALVGFSVGLAIERIINAMKEFIEGKLPAGTTPAGTTPAGTP